ncbi:MAG: hypothetical protein EVG15_05335 [Candidatus Acididesulfobacter diazotrophicus]|jgi:hypothetical protein|uniref:Uncharacterized protein n=1 Tax=Candidatus Acididesulfobacter diazotrophicus TaxID=2597226 RepID=A0A519BMX6_9DELT|nr:MAG: hypothetical protein EVG15_05335 [Candidatus Acididesulfobacter diazotrophicus]
MKRIKIEEASEGNILAKNIVLENGIVLLSKKSTLTKSLINQIKKQNVFFIYIENNSKEYGDDIAYIKNETIKNNLSDIEERFILVKDIKLMKDIENIVKEVITKGYSD